jgi:small subunit ribosomal protein S1
MRDLIEEEAASEEDYSQYTNPSNEVRGFQIGEVIGEQLKKLK